MKEWKKFYPISVIDHRIAPLGKAHDFFKTRSFKIFRHCAASTALAWATLKAQSLVLKPFALFPLYNARAYQEARWYKLGRLLPIPLALSLSSDITVNGCLQLVASITHLAFSYTYLSPDFFWIHFKIEEKLSHIRCITHTGKAVLFWYSLHSELI